MVGGLDVGLVWYPPAFGNPGWEFGSITAALNGLPLPLMGLALILASSIALGRGLMARVVVALSIVLVILILGAAVLYALTVPLALKSVTDPIALSGLHKAVVRSALQLLVYPPILLYVGWRAFRAMREGDR